MTDWVKAEGDRITGQAHAMLELGAALSKCGPMTDEERAAFADARAKMAALALRMPVSPLAYVDSPWKPRGHPAWCVEATFEGNSLRVSVGDDGHLLGSISHDGEHAATSLGTRRGRSTHNAQDPSAVVRETLLNLRRRASDMDRLASKFAEALGISLEREP